MTSIDTLIWNFEEIRRRSTLLWQGIPEAHLHWKPDPEALSIIEMIRHVLESEHLFHRIVINRGDLGAYPSPWADRPYTNVADELAFAQTYRSAFFAEIRQFSVEDLDQIWIDRKEVNQLRKLGDYLLRIAYHEAVHTGQLLDYLRTLGVPRPQVWD